MAVQNGALGDPPKALTTKGRRTRNALIQAAREVFEDKGYDEARIAQISEKASIAYGGFYTYFDSKHEIFREVVKVVTGDMWTSSRSGLASEASPVERIREATERYLLAYRTNAQMMHVLESVSPRDEYFRMLLLEIRATFLDRIVAGTRRLQEEGLADQDIDVLTTADVLGGMVEHAARMWFLMGKDYDQEVLLKTLTRVWARGIGLDYPGPTSAAENVAPETPTNV